MAEFWTGVLLLPCAVGAARLVVDLTEDSDGEHAVEVINLISDAEEVSIWEDDSDAESEMEIAG